MSIADQITRLQNAKASIKTSIENKGVTVSDDTKLDGYPALIDNIQTGGSGETYINPDFYEIRTQSGTTYESLFVNDGNTALDLSNWDTSKVTTMKDMFDGDTNVRTIKGLKNWNTSKVTSMYRMFYFCYNLTSLDLSGWNTSNVTNIGAMFYYCGSLTSVNLSGWNTSKVTSMPNTFDSCSGLTSVNLSGWDTSKVTSMYGFFASCSNLVTVTGALDLSSLTEGFYYSSTRNPVYSCKKLETLYLKNIYKNCTMTNKSDWSINLGDTKVKDECLIYIINELPDLVNDKGLTATDKIILTLPKTNTLTAEQVKVATDKGWTVANTTY